MSSNTDIRVERVEQLDQDLVEQVGALVAQLSASAPRPKRPELQEILESPATTLFVALDASSKVVGSLTLAVFRLPSGVRAWIEDVVVAEDARGHGIGALLVDTAVSVASKMGARTVDLTSRPDRLAANRLYQRAGFEVRRTNVYRYSVADHTDHTDHADHADHADHGSGAPMGIGG